MRGKRKDASLSLSLSPCALPFDFYRTLPFCYHSEKFFVRRERVACSCIEFPQENRRAARGANGYPRAETSETCRATRSGTAHDRRTARDHISSNIYPRDIYSRAAARARARTMTITAIITFFRARTHGRTSAMVFT